MNKLKHLNALIAGALILGLAGCGEVLPENITAWKDAGKTQKLIGALNAPDQYIRIDAIEALGELKAHDAVGPLGALIADPDKVVAHAAIAALAEIGGPEIEQPMLKAIQADTQPARLTAAKMLGELKSTAAVEPLIGALDDELEKIQIAAAVSLGQIGDPKAIPALAKTAQSNSSQLRHASLVSIAAIGGDDALVPLAEAMGDVSELASPVVVAGLIGYGEDAKPHALKELRGENSFLRADAVAVLEGINAIPTAGSDRLWYEIAKLSLQKKITIHREAAKKLGEIEGSHDALLEAVAHEDERVREHAFIALETIGEPIAAAVAARAAELGTPEAVTWFQGRENWAGAPDWRLDLWGGATALNPRFDSHRHAMKILRDDPKQASNLLNAKNFKPSRELIPLMIAQYGHIDSEAYRVTNQSPSLFGLTILQNDSKGRDSNPARMRTRHARTMKRLVEAGDLATAPLIVALNAEDTGISARAAQTLVKTGEPTAPEAIVAAYATRLEAGEKLSGTLFHDAMQDLNLPGAEELLLRTRPDARRAVIIFERKHPGTQVTNLPLPAADPHPTAEPFKLSYVKEGRTKELRVIFRKDGNGEWAPDPALPDELP